jgi:putative hemolysin
MPHTSSPQGPGFVTTANQPAKLLDLRPKETRTLAQRVMGLLAGPLERVLHLNHINDIHAHSCVASDATAFLNRVLEYLEVRFQLPAEDLLSIPKTGPVLVVANHPFGALDGIVLGAVLRSIRPDVKLMANYMLGQIPELRDLFIFVDPFNGEDSVVANRAGMRQSLRWLKDGGMLATFPAGEVAHLSLKKRQVREQPWNSTIARMAVRSGVPVLPIFFDGRNSNTFQLLGLLHPRLRTAMLAREVWTKRRSSIVVRVGSVISSKKLESFEDDGLLAAHLRQRTLMLRHRVTTAILPANGSTSGSGFAQIIERVDPLAVADEVARLLPSQKLVDADEYQVYCASADELPNTLREIGRLREITFRATGEGTGKAIDLDEFDSDYLHLFVWQKDKQELVGAYRLGRTDHLMQKFGPAGFYTRTLFDFDERLLHRIGIGLEMGRSFIRAEYQRAYAPLLLLWRGIGTYCVQNPQYKTLFGPVSISNDYQTVSKQLMVKFLKANHSPADAADLVRPRNPFRTGRIAGFDESPGLVNDQEGIAELISELEPDGKGMPVLLRQYLKLGAELLAFNVDRAFNDAVDGLIVVDLTQTDPRVLPRYMGKEGYARFMAYHADQKARRDDQKMQLS